MTIWLTMLGMAFVTFLTRAGGLVLLRGEPPAWLARWLGYVPIAVFTALVVPAILVRTGASGPALTIGPGLAAGMIGALVAWRRGGVVATIIAGLATFWLLRWLGWGTIL
ncbi:MAG: AzlD domain-containing protein [Roseiflexaceae bacterium]|nr:AzlD domain-containing protein [Roseiflexaceae bacterium]